MAETTNPQPFYGNPLVGTWWCPDDHGPFYPLPLSTLKLIWLGTGWGCPTCGKEMTYDESA